VHGIPGKRKLVEGDIISMDCGTVFEGFVADSAITVGVGELSPAAKKLIEVTEGALEIGITKMVAGLHVGDISASIQQYVESRGYYVTRVYTGHGVGRQMHEGPQVPNYGEPGTGLLLKTGMTIALEPMVLIGTQNTRTLRDNWTVISTDRSLTAHCEHSVAVTESGPLVLTLP
jgi:methionyl aminopeptidase